MLKIGKEQVEAFKAQARARFEDELASYFEKNSPNKSHSHDNHTTKKIIQTGIDKALLYGFQSKKEIERYVHLLLMLPADFEVDPKFSWAVTILAEKHLTSKVRFGRIEEEMKIFIMSRHPGSHTAYWVMPTDGI
jgi:hypothetical protein